MAVVVAVRVCVSRLPFLPDDILRELGLNIQQLRDQKQSHLLMEWAAMDARFNELAPAAEDEDAALLKTAVTFRANKARIQKAFNAVSKHGHGKLAPVSALYAALEDLAPAMK